jgi:hypothetical protein
MLARAYVRLQFPILVTEAELFDPSPYMVDGYRISVFSLQSSNALKSSQEKERYTINGSEAIQMDVLIIEFHKSEFNRTLSSEPDPPIELLNSAISSFLTRLRSVTNSIRMDKVEIPYTPWELHYLNDDGSPLEKDERFLRFRGGHFGEFGWTTMNKEIWDSTNSLPHDYSMPVWHDLILRAYGALPSIGPAVVLAYSALEVFIARTLDELAKESNIDPNLWTWINERDRDFEKCPSTEEQYDSLLALLAGESLKNRKALWKGFKRLRKARNSFVHEGCALRLDDKEPVSAIEDQELVKIAWDTISFVRVDLLKQLDKRPKVSVDYSFKEHLRPDVGPTPI